MYSWQRTVRSGGKVGPGHSEAVQAVPVQPSHRWPSPSLVRSLSAICEPALVCVCVRVCVCVCVWVCVGVCVCVCWYSVT